MIAIEENDYIYYKLDVESGELDSYYIGTHNQTYNQTNYYTAVIDSIHDAISIDALYMNHYGVWGYYNGNTYLTDIPPPRWGVLSEIQASFDYENFRVKIV